MLQRTTIIGSLAALVAASLLSVATPSLAGGGCYYNQGHSGGCIWVNPPHPYYPPPYPPPPPYYPPPYYPPTCRPETVVTYNCYTDSYGNKQCTKKETVHYVC